ncbi:hypothetical protein Tco_0500294 [Tanacetum coccineum]
MGLAPPVGMICFLSECHLSSEYYALACGSSCIHSFLVQRFVILEVAFWSLRFALAFWSLCFAHCVLPQDHYVFPQDHCVLPQDHCVLPQDHCVLPQDHCVLPQDHCVLPQDHCVLPQDHCVLLQDLTAFCFKTSLRFASISLRFASISLRFASISLSFAQDLHCVLLEDLIAFCLRKENGFYILQSIDQGPFDIGTTRTTLGTTPEGGVLLGPVRPRTYDDLDDNEKKRFDAGSELTKEDKESQLYDEFELFKMLPCENINEYYVRFHKLVNDIRNIRMTMPNIQLNFKFVNNMLPEWDRFVTAVKLNKDGQIVVQNVQGRQNQNQRNFARGNGAAGFGGMQNRAGNVNAGQGTVMG